MTTSNDVLQLGAGEVSVGLVPGIGGSVGHFRHRGVNLMRPLSEADRAAGNVLGVAMFPMTPYANRIANNAFTFDGRTYRVEANNPPEKFNVHGTGWHRAWTVADQSTDAALLTLEVVEPGAAYAYRASQRFTVHAGGMDVRMSITNLGDVAMPFGFGQHPWFERDADTTLKFNAATFYLEEPNGVSGDPITLPPELDFATGRALPDGWRNNDFGGWDGVATITWPSRKAGLAIRGDAAFGHLMVYADPQRSFFCVEPQTNASGAFDRPDGYTDPAQGVMVLRPGESASGSVQFEVIRPPV
ncbi:MAG TPA: aldose 1-epimerase [Devosia sp.]|nr:aldose 1-epimerase [Devosia sp.]